MISKSIKMKNILMKHFQFKPEVFKPLIYFGLPSLGFAVVDIVAFQILSLSAGTFGVVSLATHQLLFMILCLGYMIVF